MRGRSQRKTNQRLKLRQAAAAPKHLESEFQGGARTKPGSRNAHKSISLATRPRQNKKGNKR